MRSSKRLELEFSRFRCRFSFWLRSGGDIFLLNTRIESLFSSTGFHFLCLKLVANQGEIETHKNDRRQARVSNNLLIGQMCGNAQLAS
mmetsp:Transcript_6996/g.8829  ORF Transcript_6996/g.8829 Transcript_6996/m.8829 type:complete len:88 (+) Transcript_6996:725-988(+)